MIRIDEIYNNLFLPLIQKKLSRTRLFFCDPPGTSSPENLLNYGSDINDSKYVFLHDQEPIFLSKHEPLFNSVIERNSDINYPKGATVSAIITSEYASKDVGRVCLKYNWKHYYYFFHGWAALDWYRGYDKTYLSEPPANRSIKHSLFAPNRIIGGNRDHRVLLYYLLSKNNVNNALVSMPETCPVEQQSAASIGNKFLNRYPDIVETIVKTDLPKHLPDESGHPMTSCWLDRFDLANQTFAYLVTETVYFGQKNHLTEKTFKPICYRMPFILCSTAGSLEYLRSYGFKTFSEFWNEDYDCETDDFSRLEKIAELCKQIDNMSVRELNQLAKHTAKTVEHNYQHFYNGNFEKILWRELESMLDRLIYDFSI